MQHSSDTANPDKRGSEDNSKIFFLFLNENICCDPFLERSQRDGSNDGSQNMLLTVEIWIIIPKLSLIPLLIWSTAANSSKEIPLLT